MKALGIVQFHQKKFELLDLGKTPYRTHLGNIPKSFTCVVGGFSGNGKTEYCVRLAKFLCGFGKVGWFSFEQRHGFDLQLATRRNKMEEQNGLFIPIDPISNLPQGKTYLEDICEYLDKRNSPLSVFIDSIDYTGWKKEDYLFLKERYDGKKILIFICHTDQAGNPRKTIAKDIIFDGGMFILVSKYIATPIKNRFGGFDPYVIWEEKARELNPAFFAKEFKKPAKVNGKTKDQQPQLFDNSNVENEGIEENIVNESEGVCANDLIESEG
ncbi:hypothetical protein QT327_21360 [Olivibacter sp. 47]|uniref:hypothetical protein n=1 Tax=Olivibacter sp. 47 TaxID=3056486 RepID=UPI0025A3FCD9|nr:hypothetical protein [Olivibacter sp. 47]MDM8176865.1 hypothetical protein [Olivibacter sp. 47]